ncbi:hypothetical protein SARC_00256 [Sphaeroforma arctica JP610]|uniref:PCI domain-containing protein n=1 Tax=Sphaeroforma arctica JP610 TaxID=667725 RepID=A0A0L0GF15_9EUKA|nr:hypothetical protein SARC_00256 [Sphaeroforma arctica JP610]KNC87625.1 hypothetical protein SARC_00256 [Sphaeroforma arctica JP610]|eukprot:XP_014161527.1 hypothetical protein SARC_00256 [Sphaeroforma arctica JP610]
MDEYIDSLTQYLEAENGQGLAYSLSCNGRHTKNVRRDALKTIYWERQIKDNFSEWADDYIPLFISHVKSLLANNPKDRFDQEYDLCNAFLQIFSQNEAVGWANPALGLVLKDLRVLADQADMGTSGKNEYKEKSGRLMMKLLAPACMDKDESENSRRWASLSVANNLFKLFSKLNLSMCDQTRATIYNNFNDAYINERFPISHVTTFRYLVGYQHFFKGNYDEARIQFGYAFDFCSRQFPKNIQLILLYLIPLNLLKGITPTEGLLKLYKLDQYKSIVHALKAGDVRAFNMALKDQESFLEKRGLFLLMERLKTVAYRNLLRKVWLIKLKECQLAGTPFNGRIRLEDFRVALQFVHYKCSLEEVECIVAVLVFKKFVKGYISHGHKLLVVSRKAEDVTFPPINDCDS